MIQFFLETKSLDKTCPRIRFLSTDSFLKGAVIFFFFYNINTNAIPPSTGKPEPGKAEWTASRPPFFFGGSLPSIHATLRALDISEDSEAPSPVYITAYDNSQEAGWLPMSK